MTILKVDDEDRNIGYDLNITKTIDEVAINISIINIPTREIAKEIETQFSTYDFSLTFESLVKEYSFRRAYCVDYMDLVTVVESLSHHPIPKDTIYFYAVISVNLVLTKEMIKHLKKDEIKYVSIGADYKDFRYFKVREDVDAQNAIAAVKEVIKNPRIPILFDDKTRMCSLFILAELVNLAQSISVSEIIPVFGNRLENQLNYFKTFELQFTPFIRNMNTVQAIAFLNILKTKDATSFDPLGHQQEDKSCMILAKLMPLITDKTIAASSISKKELSRLQHIEAIGQKFIEHEYGSSIIQDAKESLKSEPYDNKIFSIDSLIIYQSIAFIQEEESIPIEVRLALDGLV